MSDSHSILIAEDEFMLTMLLEHILKQNGYSDIHFVKNGDEAVEKAREVDPSIILMDIFLEGSIDGIEAVEKIREFSSNVPVIYITGNSDSVTKSKALESGCTSYILKPIDPEHMLKLINDKLRKKEENNH